MSVHTSCPFHNKQRQVAEQKDQESDRKTPTYESLGMCVSVRFYNVEHHNSSKSNIKSMFLQQQLCFL